MSLLSIPKTPVKAAPKCLACAWVATLDADEQQYLAQLVKNYSVAGLYKELTPLGVTFAESTLRNHVTSGH